MEIHNVHGQRAATLIKEDLPAGYHVAEWNGTGTGGEQLASGVYFLQLWAAGNNEETFSELRKLILQKQHYLIPRWGTEKEGTHSHESSGTGPGYRLTWGIGVACTFASLL